MKYKRLGRFAAAALALLMTAASVGCGKKGGEKANEETEAIEKTTVLTNVFESSTIEVPENFYISSSVVPYYDEETGDLRVLAENSYESEEVDPEYGYNLWIQENYILTIRDGVVSEQKKIDIPDTSYINDGVLTAESLYFTASQYDESGATVYMNIFNLNDGTLVKSDKLNGMFTETVDQYFYIERIAVDKEGMIYMASSDNEIVVMNSSFEKQFSIPLQSWIRSMTTTADGSTVYVYTYDYSGQNAKRVFKPIDKAGKCFGDPLEIDDSSGSIGECYFGAGYDVYYTGDNALWGYNFPSEETVAADAADTPDAGNAAGESDTQNTGGADNAEEALEGAVKIIDFPNSDMIMDNVDIAKIVSPDTVLVYEQDPDTFMNSLTMLKRGADVDLSQVKVIEIASVGYDYLLNNDIVKFNKKNRGSARVILRDYSVYNVEENYNAGSEKLTKDMLTGIYKPDMVTSYSTSNDIISQIYRNNLYADLYQYIDKSSHVSRDDIFGCVKRTFEDENGALWAIGPTMQIQTLLVKNSDLQRSGLNLSGTGWTISDMLAFEKTLPDGESLFAETVTKENMGASILGSFGYGAFVDLKNGTCSFDGPEFMSYLELLQTLPDKYVYSDDHDWNSDYIPYHEGKIALGTEYYYDTIDFVRDETVFNTKDFTRIGYPTSDGRNGSEVRMTPYIITKYCEYPEEAWAFVEQLLGVADDAKESSSVRYYGRDGISVLKSLFYEACENAKKDRYEIYFNGSMSWGGGDAKDEITDEELERELTEPGIVRRFTDENKADIENWLENVVGKPIADQVDDSIKEIVTEEVSAYLSGAKTAEDCARIIQSRVTIWISEHS